MTQHQNASHTASHTASLTVGHPYSAHHRAVHHRSVHHRAAQIQSAMAVAHWLTADQARRKAKRAARLVMRAFASNVILRCRADLTANQILRLNVSSARQRATAQRLLAAFEVQAQFRVDEEALRKASIGFARYVTRGEICAARRWMEYAVGCAVTPTAAKI